MRKFSVSMTLVVLVTSMAALAPSAFDASPASATGTTSTPAAVTYSSSTTSLADLGVVNLAAQGAEVGSPPLPNTNPATGFDGINGVQQAAVNGGADSGTPDQGTCAGPDATGAPIVVEIINNALSAYTQSGDQELGVTPTYALFNQPSATYLSDPRCYYDANTQRWFFTMFTVGNPAPSTQFIAVSESADPLGNYHVFGIDTTDATNPTGRCPCAGDFDMIGADANGFYISTTDAPVDGGIFTGTVVYAMSKQGLAAAADGASVPSVARYQITADGFGPLAFRLSPASTPPGGAFAPNTEYFVESNIWAASATQLMVYAMTDTETLATGGVPPLEAVEVTTEAYSAPPAATQPSGTTPLGTEVGAAGVSPIQSNLDNVQQVTYTGGQIYAELSTSVGDPNAPTVGVAWFRIAPSVSGAALSAKVAKQGYLTDSRSLLYPDIVVDAAGHGFLAFSMAGAATYPSAAYTAFDATNGPTGGIQTAAAGTAPEDGFTCYASLDPADGGSCRWGDYSGAAVWGGRAYMMAEYIPATARDHDANWGTYAWSAALPTPTVTKVARNYGSAAGGATVTISGHNFTAANAVDFGATSATSFQVNAAGTTIKAVTPPGSGTVDVTVTVGDFTSPASSADRYSYGPLINKVNPASGSSGGNTKVHIAGHNFTGATAVAFGGVPALAFTVNATGTAITATSPPEVGSGVQAVDVSVTNTAGTGTLAAGFTYAMPVVTKISPLSGPFAGGTKVAIHGLYFMGNTSILFGDLPAVGPITVNATGTVLTAYAPPGEPGAVDITVTTAAGTSDISANDLYTYSP